MAKNKIAFWNIYFSWKLIGESRGKYYFKEKKRSSNVADIINSIDASILGIAECMSEEKLRFFRDSKFPQYTGILMNGNRKNYNIGMLYKSNLFEIRKLPLNTERWKAKIGNDRVEKFYKFTRAPLCVEVKCRETHNTFVLSVVHSKSKRPSNNLTREEREREAIQNRKRIVAEGLRLRELLFKQAEELGKNYDQFIVMGDINDGPDFDKYEKQIFHSGIESLLGTVLDPKKILYSTIDLSDGKGQPSSSFAKGSVQLDHIVYNQSLIDESRSTRIVESSGRIRSDLVNIKRDGKKRDSDHAPVEVWLNL